MLYSVDSNKSINYIPHKREFDVWCSRLSNQQLKIIRSELQKMIDGSEVHTSSWMPGANWGGTPWDPIYTKACENDYNAAARCFGLFVWEAFLNHEETWSFERYNIDEDRIWGLTYFKISNPI